MAKAKARTDKIIKVTTIIKVEAVDSQMFLQKLMIPVRIMRKSEIVFITIKAYIVLVLVPELQRRFQS